MVERQPETGSSIRRTVIWDETFDAGIPSIVFSCERIDLQSVTDFFKSLEKLTRNVNVKAS